MAQSLLQTAFSALYLSLLTTGADAVIPVTITSTKVDVNHDGTFDTVSVQMIKGRRYHDNNDWCGKGEKYEGSFTIVVDFHGRRVETSLDSLLGGAPLWFGAQPWQLNMADYNDDGDIDFNLGQYGSCNGWIYWILSIRQSGRVERISSGLRVNDFAESTAQITPLKKGFRAEYYDNARGGNWAAIYRWNPIAGTFEKENERRID